MLKFLALSLFLVGCASSPLDKVPAKKRIDYLSILGEGRGRLSVKKQQYVFSVDALLKKTSWLLAASIPLHGEEVLELKNLERKSYVSHRSDSFEARVNHALEEIYPGKNYSEKFILELRSFVRLILAHNLGLERSCTEDSCVVEGDQFDLETIKNSFMVSKRDSNGFVMSLTGENLNNQIFEKLTFKIISPEKESVLTLEFFWKNT